MVFIIVDLVVIDCVLPLQGDVGVPGRSGMPGKQGLKV